MIEMTITELLGRSPMTVSVRYDMTHEDDRAFAKPIAQRHICLLPPWAGNDGEEAAKAVAVEHMRDVWEKEIGEDDDAIMLVRVMSPEEISGTYEVTLAKTIVSSSVRKVED
jgi:hypothetical protein